MADKKITLSDIEESIRSLQGGVERATDAAMPARTPLLAGVAGGVAVFIYLVGYRKGRKRSTILEIKSA